MLAFATITLLTVYYSVRQNAEQRLRQETRTYMAQLVSQLDSMLAQHAYLPALLAESAEIRDYMRHASPDTAVQTRINQHLANINRIAETLDVYLMKPDGITVAASNWDKPSSFIGGNFGFRPYFSAAIQGELGRYYALGTTSRERGYYFAAPIHEANGNGTGILGVVVVKVAIEAIEQAWNHATVQFMVTDPDGIVFVASQPAWRLRALQDLPATVQETLRQNRRYAGYAIQTLPDLHIQPVEGFQMAQATNNQYLVLRNTLAVAGWDVYILSDWSIVSRQIILTLLLTTLLLALTLLLVYLLWNSQRQRRQYEQRTLGELEAMVEKRTCELRHTQEELVQAAKMAALGQLSAGINHELNNPLTAIRAYADNAIQFLGIGKADMAHHNLHEIVALTERMAAITRQLKTFSRKSAGQLTTCDIYNALDAALSIVQPKLAQSQVNLAQQRAENARYVQADQVWLEQILVNLLTNAVEAVQEQAEQHVWISVQCTGEYVAVQVRDNGTGISPHSMPHVFEAFFTTKTIGKGLGLGLSISYRLARDMRGNLSVANASEGGAVFTLTLPLAETGKTGHDEYPVGG